MGPIKEKHFPYLHMFRTKQNFLWNLEDFSKPEKKIKTSVGNLE